MYKQDKKDDRVFSFNISAEKKVEVFIGNEHVEIYNPENIDKTGFIFDNFKEFALFINNITDICKDKITNGV